MWTLKSFRSSTPRPPHATARRWELEALEGRALLSGGAAKVHPHGTPHQAEVAHPAKAQHQVPFRGSLEGFGTITPLGPMSASAHLEGTGTASHLGRFTFSSTADLDFATNIGIATWTFTAANGDTLTATAIGTGSDVPTGTPEAIYIIETGTITGGTGRFAGATGRFIMVRYFNMTTGETNGTFEGKISPPGARHP
jgi:hypothetical protein